MNSFVIIAVNRLSSLLKDEPVHEHAAVLSYEAGGVLQHAMYGFWAKDPQDKAVANGLLDSELQDVLAQVWTLAIKRGKDPVALLYEGCMKAVQAIELKHAGKLKEKMEEKC